MKRFPKAIICTVIAVLILVCHQLYSMYFENINGFLNGSNLYKDKQYNIADNSRDDVEIYDIPTTTECKNKLLHINKRTKGDAYHTTYNKKKKKCYIHFIDNTNDNSLGYYNKYKNSIYNNHNIYFHPLAKTKKYKNIDTHKKCNDIAKKDSAILSLYDPHTDLCTLVLKGYYDKDTVNWTIL